MAKYERETEEIMEEIMKHDWLYYDDPDLAAVSSKENLFFEMDLVDYNIESQGKVIVKGDVRGTEIHAKGIVIVNNCNSCKIFSEEDIYILGNCDFSDIKTTGGKIFIMGDLSGGFIAAKEVTVLGKEKNRPDVIRMD